MAALSEIEGVNAVAAIIREPVGFIDGPSQRGTVLGVDPLTIPKASWWRDSFADGEPAPLNSLMAPLRRTLTPQASGIALPLGTERIVVWARRDDGRELGSSVPLPSYRLWARIGDERGFYRNLELGVLAPRFGTAEGWQWLNADMPEVGSDGVIHQWRVVSVHISGEAFARTPPGGLSLDDVTAYGAGLPPAGEVVEGFEDVGPWTAFAPGRGGSGPGRTLRRWRAVGSRGDADTVG